EAHALDERIDFGEVLLACLGIGAALETPLSIAFGAFRFRSTEHVEAGRVPEVDRLLHALTGLTASGGHFGSARRSEVDVAGLLLHHPRRVLQQTRHWRVGAAGEFLRLVPADAVDEKAEDGKVFPGGDQAAERLQIALLARPTQDVGRVDAEVAGEARELAEVIDFFGRGARD